MTAVRRLPVADELLIDDELVVLAGQRVIVLSPLASYTLTTLGADWTEVRWLREQLVAAFGAPERDDALDELLTTLADEGLAEVRP